MYAVLGMLNPKPLTTSVAPEELTAIEFVA
jgi:hypothetical protein